MTAMDTGARNASAVRVRAEGEVGEEILAYVRAKIDAVVDRLGLSAISGEVRIAKAVAHHAEHPWSAVAEVQVGSTVVVVHAREATGQEVADRLQDRLRRQVERAVHDGNAARKPVAPPWRGGQTAEAPASGSVAETDARSA